jgi:hypothetical protein
MTKLTERVLHVVKSIASLNYSRRNFYEYASEDLRLSTDTVKTHLYHARTYICVADTPSLIICLVSGGFLSLDELVAEKEEACFCRVAAS